MRQKLYMVISWLPLGLTQLAVNTITQIATPCANFILLKNTN